MSDVKAEMPGLEVQSDELEVMPLDCGHVFIALATLVLLGRFFRWLFRRESGLRLEITEEHHRKISEILDPDNRELRTKMWTVFNDELYYPRYDILLKDDRELAYKRLKKFCDARLVSVTDFKKDPRRIFAAHEIAGFVDGSMATKMTVQFNLFGGTVFKLGTDFHHKKMLEGIDSFNQPGCFALTELGYGNNAVEMETTAIYDAATKEFIINTPSTLAQKYWITNGAVHAKWCVVFARLLLKDKDEGVHGFLVRIRDESLTPLPGVTIQDMGHKIGVNGVDNARLWFNNVRVPREHLLNATSQVSEDGVLTCPIPSRRGRFLAMADQLLSGRICIACMTLSGSKMSLYATVRYAHSRLAVGRDGKSSAPLMDFQLQQRAIMPFVAATYAYAITLSYIKDRYAGQTKKDNAEVVRLICGIKALITWHAERAASICRERCGGQGYLSANRFGEAIGGAHAGITAEGDNCVLMQKLSKELLATVGLAGVATYNVQSYLPNAVQRLVTGTSCSNVASPSTQLALLRARENRTLRQLASKLAGVKGTALYETWVQNEQDLVQQTARAFTERTAVEHFQRAVSRCKDATVAKLLAQVCSLYAVSRIEADLAWFLTEGLMTPAVSRKVSELSRQLCTDLSPYSLDLVKGFGVPEFAHHSPIARDWEEYNVQQLDNIGEHFHRVSNKNRK
eukprot:TRINITY_DN7982_c0_g1::TRINITY_DN7982_c0_g1_i1::g.15532::m.15532 TRINITY_DN7982_c0_g1::TRINITY_DN7982_c0_g1_i1::g.15532  ORF type:complete len:699 (+),score=253.45,sp/O64894/ACOX2_CUCMA/35.81/2e-110,ACOX/PF01756.14/6.6e-15,Acyl-CoA_dh_M/PF02770.14/3.5e-11,Acyl-CoA_dh_1/PF00441.19/5.7e-06,Acyl-CoA_dh_1/PF00441.19/3.7e+03,DUF4412/PF14371.1/0.44 TRINITY_DN7982_c0_g1_i1:51-2099(+)